MYTKRGLSNIIGTVLIVLLALAAIAIVWNFLAPTFTGAGETIDISQKCLIAELKPTSCVIAGGTATINVQNVRGDATDMRVIIEDPLGVTAVGDSAIAPTQLLATASGTVTVPAGFDATTVIDVKAYVAPIVTGSNGEQGTCPQSPTVITCTT